MIRLSPQAAADLSISSAVPMIERDLGTMKQLPFSHPECNTEARALHCASTPVQHVGTGATIPFFKQAPTMKLRLSILPLCALFLLESAMSQVGSRPVLTAAPQSAPAATGKAAPPGGKNGASMALSPEYRIGAYDMLQVTVWKELQLSGAFPVRPDGMISLVLLGDIPAAGITPMELGQNITAALKKYIQEPLVTVTVTAVNSQKVYVVGQVGHVGAIDLSPGMTPLEAIAAAGGLTTYANGKNAYILRGEPGKQKRLPFDYKKALKGQPGQAIVLQTGDTLVIP